MFTLIFRGFAEWMFIIGVYGVTRELVSKSYSWLSPLSQLAMPFYLTHQQILVIIAVAASWYPHFSKYSKGLRRFCNKNTYFVSGLFPVILILATVGTLLVSRGITKAEYLRYFWGLPTKDSSVFPGKIMRGSLPSTVMIVLFVIAYILANFL